MLLVRDVAALAAGAHGSQDAGCSRLLPGLVTVRTAADGTDVRVRPVVHGFFERSARARCLRRCGKDQLRGIDARVGLVRQMLSQGFTSLRFVATHDARHASTFGLDGIRLRGIQFLFGCLGIGARLRFCGHCVLLVACGKSRAG